MKVKKVISAALAAATVLATGICTPVMAKADDEVPTITNWGWDTTWYEPMFAAIEESHPNIKIEYTMLTVDQFKNTIVTMIKSGEGPDLFPIPVGLTLNTAVDEGWFQPINNYVTDDFRDKFDPASFAEGVTDIGEDWYTVTEQMPIIQCLFFYNKDILDQAGITDIPRTYSEFRDACKKVTEMGNGNVYGLIDGGKQMNRMDVMASTANNK